MIPLADMDELVRRAAFAQLLRTREPVDLHVLAALTGLTSQAVDTAVDRMGEVGWLDRDADGRITGSAGLSLTTGPHRLSLSYGDFQTWCAYDSLGIAGALRGNATVETTCAVCGRPIVVEVMNASADKGRPERLWLAERGEDLRTGFCAPTVLLCSPEHADEWADRNAHRGQALRLDEAVQMGAAAWAPTAAALRDGGS